MFRSHTLSYLRLLGFTRVNQISFKPVSSSSQASALSFPRHLQSARERLYCWKSTRTKLEIHVSEEKALLFKESFYRVEIKRNILKALSQANDFNIKKNFVSGILTAVTKGTDRIFKSSLVKQLDVDEVIVLGADEAEEIQRLLSFAGDAIFSS